MMGFELRDCRRQAGLSQAALAHFLGVARPTISDWERGHTPISRVAEIATRAVVEQFRAGRLRLPKSVRDRRDVRRTSVFSQFRRWLRARL
jgi:transcriptional regulator with XRE-family HTH domain